MNTPMTSIILVSGNPVPTGVIDIPSHARVLAADGGMTQADRLGLDVDLLVGDMDSIDEESLRAARARGVETHLYPVEKDATDLELALGEALARGNGPVLVIGGGGGRLDHFIGNAMLLAARARADRPITWWTGSETAAVAKPEMPVRIHGKAGDWLSLIPVGGPATGVVVRGSRWELDGADLHVGSTRGISNVLTEPHANVSVASGTLLVIHTDGSIR